MIQDDGEEADLAAGGQVRARPAPLLPARTATVGRATAGRPVT
ncbi:hypothetical protein [Pseudofrankia asymbiotica]|nr:hypothetical protein [Pseudofrankia asymbiotica]